MKSRTAKRSKYIKAKAAIIERQLEQVIHLTSADVDRLVALLKTPPQPNERLRKAFASHRARVLAG